MEKYIKDGQVAILVSYGFGSGWSTWNDKKLAYDRRAVEFFLEHEKDKDYMHRLSSYKSKESKEAKELFKSWGYENVYFGGFENIEICWLPIGTTFVISEYDGAESVEIIGSFDWTTA